MARHEGGGGGGGILYSMHTSISLSPMQSDTPLPVPPRLPLCNSTTTLKVLMLQL